MNAPFQRIDVTDPHHILRWAKAWIQHAADLDRDAAYAEYAERAYMFTLADVQPGRKYRVYETGEVRTFVSGGRPAEILAVTDHYTMIGFANAQEAVDFYNKENCWTTQFVKIAP